METILLIGTMMDTEEEDFEGEECLEAILAEGMRIATMKEDDILLHHHTILEEAILTGIHPRQNDIAHLLDIHPLQLDMECVELQAHSVEVPVLPLQEEKSDHQDLSKSDVQVSRALAFIHHGRLPNWKLGNADLDLQNL